MERLSRPTGRPASSLISVLRMNASTTPPSLWRMSNSPSQLPRPPGAVDGDLGERMVAQRDQQFEDRQPDRLVP